MIGKKSAQKTASGSRQNSRMRTRINCLSESRITQVSSGKGNEDVFQCRRVRPQLREARTQSLDE
jgi:hypothetical protein